MKDIELWKEEMHRRLKNAGKRQDSLSQESVTFSSTALSASDPALSRARSRLTEIAVEQRSLNRQKQLLSKELRNLLKQYPSLKTK